MLVVAVRSSTGLKARAVAGHADILRPGARTSKRTKTTGHQTTGERRYETTERRTTERTTTNDDDDDDDDERTLRLALRSDDDATRAEGERRTDEELMGTSQRIRRRMDILSASCTHIRRAAAGRFTREMNGRARLARWCGVPHG